MPENPFTVTVHATVTVTDLDALVGQVDGLVALSPHYEPMEDGTYWDGWEEREGTGYLGHCEFVWLDDDARAMLDLALTLAHLRAKGVELETLVFVESDDDGGPDTSTFTVELVVLDAEVTHPRSAAGWLGAVKTTWPLLVRARAAAALLETVAGCEVVIESVVATQEDLPPGTFVDARQAEISLLPPADPDPGSLPEPGERIVVTDGGRDYETDDNGHLLVWPPGYPADRSLRRPVRFDGRTARRLVHFMHPIPVGRGFLMAWVTDNVPGWDGNGLLHALGAAGLIARNGQMPKLVDGVAWVDIEPSGLCSRIELDPAALRR